MILFRAISQVIRRMFRPWLQVEWFRKITNYEKKLAHFRNFSNEVMDGVVYFMSTILFEFYFYFFNCMHRRLLIDHYKMDLAGIHSLIN